jgi:hypothetical protein
MLFDIRGRDNVTYVCGVILLYRCQRNKKANERQFMTLYKINYQSGNLFYIFLLMPELMFSSSRKHWGWG